MKKRIIAIGGCFAAVWVGLLPLQGLTPSAKAALGILIWAIIWWAAKILPDYITALFMAVLLVLLAGVPSDIVFSAFEGSSWWLLFAAFGLSLGVAKSGLIRRLSLHVIRLFPANFQGQVLSLITVGFLTAPLIPSMSAKAAVLGPLSMGISDSLEYSQGGRQATGLFLAMLTGLRTPGPLFISASVLGYTFSGLFPESIRSRYGIMTWFLDVLPWFLCVTLLNTVALILLFRPENDCAKPQQFVSDQLKKLGPMRKSEWYMLLILLTTVLLWVTEEIHEIPAQIVALAALCLTLAWEICDQTSFRSELNWDSLIFVGIALGLSDVFAYLGISEWIVDVCSPVILPFSGNPYSLILTVALITILLRFVIVSELAFANIFMVFMIPLSMQLGINPWVIAVAVYAVINPWFFLYQNPVYMAAFYSTDGKMANANVSAKYCFLYEAICILALLVATFVWVHNGTFFLN